METLNFAIWATVVLGATSFAVISMVSAYRKPITQVPFPPSASKSAPDSVANSAANSVIEQPSLAISNAALADFTSAVSTFKATDYRGAIDQFTVVLDQEPNCAEAFHNLGLAYANIGDNDKALRSLLKASDAYDKQNTKSGLDRIKQDLQTLKQVR